MRILRERGATLSSQVFLVSPSDGPLFPCLETLAWSDAPRELVRIIPWIISPRTTTVDLTFSDPEAAPTIAEFPALCPNLSKISFRCLPRNSIITAAVSRMLLSTNENTLRYLNVDSPLTEEACGVVCKFAGLRELSVVIEEGTSFPSVVLPNLTKLTVKFGYNGDWLQGFRGAALGKLTSVTFHSESEPTDDFLEAFESVALATSTPETLSTFRFHTSHPWRPSYRSLLPFTQLKELIIDFSCERGCSSAIDVDTISPVARAMPKLRVLHLGHPPCRESSTGVTAMGLVNLALDCPDLSELCIHFRVASLADMLGTSWTSNCASVLLDVGAMPVPDGLAEGVITVLPRVFPRLLHIDYTDRSWEVVMRAILRSGYIADCSGRECLYAPRSNFSDISPRSYFRGW